jgi:hypothetical protein
LRGDRAGQHSIRINDQWRICFVWNGGGAERVEIIDYLRGVISMRDLPPIHPGEQLHEEFMNPLGTAYRLLRTSACR